MIRTAARLATAGFDAIAIKPGERSLDTVDTTVIDAVVIDFEGIEHLPDPSAIQELTEAVDVILTAPIRVDGFDPLGEDHHLDRYSIADEFAIVAGNGAYLTEAESQKAIAPRIAKALEHHPSAWVGTEGIERIALATGATQFELFSPRTHAVLASLRSAGFDGDIAVYTPTVVTDDRSEALDALEPYLSRRSRVKRALNNGVDERRHVLLQAMDDYALVGDAQAVARRIDSLKEAGATTIVGYPA